MEYIYEATVTVYINTSKNTYEKKFDRDDYESREETFKAIQEYYNEICSAID